MTRYVDHVIKSMKDARLKKSKITQDILTMEGMSGIHTRHFYNNIMSMDDARYLEIGTWKGSSVCSAMCNNKATVVCIDNWSEFGGPKQEFLENFEKFKGENNAKFIESDCFAVDVSTLPKFNVYMFDGDHNEESHYKALVHFYECMDDEFIFIVDDWNWEKVRTGTFNSFKQLNIEILYETEVRTTFDDSHPPWGSDQQRAWHNGIYVAVIRKPNPSLHSQ
jgi:hypothetical protein